MPPIIRKKGRSSGPYPRLVSSKITPTSQQVAGFWRSTGKLKDMGELASQPEYADTTATYDGSTSSFSSSSSSSSSSGGGGGGGGYSGGGYSELYEWEENGLDASRAPSMPMLLLAAVAAGALFLWVR